VLCCVSSCCPPPTEKKKKEKGDKRSRGTINEARGDQERRRSERSDQEGEREDEKGSAKTVLIVETCDNVLPDRLCKQEELVIHRSPPRMELRGFCLFIEVTACSLRSGEGYLKIQMQGTRNGKKERAMIKQNKEISAFFLALDLVKAFVMSH